MAIFMYCGRTSIKVFMPYWNFESTKDITQQYGKVGGGMGQAPATEVTHLRLNHLMCGNGYSHAYMFFQH